MPSSPPTHRFSRPSIGQGRTPPQPLVGGRTELPRKYIFEICLRARLVFGAQREFPSQLFSPFFFLAVWEFCSKKSKPKSDFQSFFFSFFFLFLSFWIFSLPCF